jgi:hypothetical protein
MAANLRLQPCEWLGRIGVKTLYFEPGSPWENGYNDNQVRIIRPYRIAHSATDRRHLKRSCLSICSTLSEKLDRQPGVRSMEPLNTGRLRNAW